jgi:hypothetical protein
MATKTHPATTKLQYDADGTPPFTDLTDITSVHPPNPKRGDSKNTHLASTSRTHTYQPSWIEPGECGFVGYFTQTQFNTLLGFFNTGTEYYWRVLLPLIDAQATNAYIAFNGYVNEIGLDEIKTDSDDLIMCPFKIKVSGLPTFSAGS